MDDLFFYRRIHFSDVCIAQMLKRHRCNIDLEKNVLCFCLANGKMETPFLHEKDLDESKGGTKGFDASKANEELEKMMKREEK